MELDEDNELDDYSGLSTTGLPEENGNGNDLVGYQW
jgi:hypothetical protein